MVGAKLAGKVKLGFFQIDRDDRGPRDLRVLQRQVTQAPDAEHRDEIGGPGARYLDRLVRGDSCAAQGGRLEGGNSRGHGHHEVAGGDRVLRVGTVDRVAAHLLAFAQCLMAGDAELAVPARPSEPRDRHPLPDPALGYPGANPLDDSDAFVARDKG